MSTPRKKAAPGSVAGNTTGKRFTKRPAFEGGLVGLDSADYFRLQRAKAEAADVLAAVGYVAASLYGKHGECFALERVRLDGHDDDSPAGLAAQALQQCRQLEAYLDNYPDEPIARAWESIADYAYRIGRCLAFAKAYNIEGAAQRELQTKGSDARRKYTKQDRELWRKLRSTKFAEHTAKRAAELIVKECGLPEEATSSVRAELGPSKKAAKSL